MDQITHSHFEGNPIPVNATLTALTVLFAGLIIGFVRSQEKAMSRRSLEIEAQEATIRSLPH